MGLASESAGMLLSCRWSSSVGSIGVYSEISTFPHNRAPLRSAIAPVYEIVEASSLQRLHDNGSPPIIRWIELFA